MKGQIHTSIYLCRLKHRRNTNFIVYGNVKTWILHDLELSVNFFSVKSLKNAYNNFHSKVNYLNSTDN